jgi:4-hydroxybenzoate polyprenyltransferase
MAPSTATYTSTDYTSEQSPSFRPHAASPRRPNLKSSRKSSSYISEKPSTTGAAPAVQTTTVQDKEDGIINFFPCLPAYSDPTTGFLSKIPSSWVPYAQLMRIDRPGGLYAFYFPYLIGLMYAACITPDAPPAPATLLRHAAVLLPFNFLLRGAACTWNDNVDQRFDRRVARTRHRAIARGAVTTSQANVFTLVQMVAGYPILRTFPDVVMPHMGVIVGLFFVYSLMKRVTYYPQVVLGFPFAWAILFCVATLGMDPLEGASRAAPTAALFAANVLWTITYDTIYAHQDIEYDEQAGVKGMALRFRHSTKALATVLSAVQVILLALCGAWAGFGAAYMVGTVGGVAAAMAYYIYDVDLDEPESCGAWFRDQFWIVGGGFIAGLTAEYALRLMA